MNIFNLFVEGSVSFMSLITILLVLLLFAAWKAPNWVKELGLAALTVGIIACLAGIYQGAGVCREMEIDAQVIFGGLRVSLIPLIYGLSVYLVSLIIRLVQKPRI